MRRALIRIAEAVERLVNVLEGTLPEILASLDSIERKLDRLDGRDRRE